MTIEVLITKIDGRRVLNLMKPKSINNADIVQEIVDYLNANPLVTGLDLSLTRITRELLLNLISRNTTLEYLDISGKVVGDNEIQKIAVHPKLKILHAARCNNVDSHDFTVEGIKALVANPRLESLNVAQNGFGDKELEILLGSTTLISLIFSKNRVEIAGVRPLRANTTLKSLNFFENLEGLTLEVLSVIAANKGLEGLNIARNQISNMGAKIIAKHSTLKRLDISDNSLTEANALAVNVKLTELDVSSNELDMQFAEKIVLNTTLRKLNMRDNKFGILETQTVLTNSSLELLDASSPHIELSSANEMILKQALHANNSLRFFQICLGTAFSMPLGLRELASKREMVLAVRMFVPFLFCTQRPEFPARLSIPLCIAIITSIVSPSKRTEISLALRAVAARVNPPAPQPATQSNGLKK